MPLYNEPVRLEKLALESMGKYVSDLSIQLVLSAQTCAPLISPTSLVFRKQTHKGFKDFLYRITCGFITVDPISLQHVQQVCKGLQNVLHAMGPSYMINSVTLEILKQLDGRHDDLCKWIEQPWCKKILEEIIKVILHPRLTDLLITWNWKFILKFILDMGDLSNLKTFKLPNTSVLIKKLKIKSLECGLMKQLHATTNLQEFIFHRYCTDEIVKVLCKYCAVLRCLDVYRSSHVTNVSVKHILKLKQLEELDVTSTGVSFEGQVQLLTGLSQNNSKLLRSYRCYLMTNAELSVLSKMFPDLSKFSSTIWPNGSAIQDFRKFQKLQVCNLYTYFDNFQFAGSHLLKLSIIGYSVNIADIFKNCPKLKSLTVKVDHLKVRHNPISGLTSLQHLTLQTRDSTGAMTVLSQCHNLLSLQLCVAQAFYFTYLEEVLKNNRLKRLQSLCIDSLTGNLSPKTVAMITEHCPNLTTVKVFGGQDAKLKVLYQQYPGVQVDFNLWIQLLDYVAFRNNGPMNYEFGY